MKHLARALSERMLGRAIELPENVSLPLFLRYYAGKGLLPLLRGAATAPFVSRARFPFFVGRDVSVRFGSRMSCGRSVSLGDGVRIDALTQEGVSLGDRVTIREGSIVNSTSKLDNLGHSLTVEDDVYIGPYAFIGVGGPITIRSRTIIGPRVTLIAEEHRFDGFDSVREQGVTRQGITIDKECWLGACVTILDGVTIGRGSVIGAGSVVTRSLPERSIAYGVPARVHGTRDDALKQAR
jgi:acetyltransferase-like isoleucine patch superfamily enzyme